MLKLIGIGLASVFGATAILLIKAFGAAILAVALPLIILAAKIALVLLILEDLWVWFKGGDSVLGALIGPWQEWEPYVMAAITMVRDAIVWFGEAIGAVAAMIVGMLTLDGALFMAGLEGLTEMLWSVIQQWWAYLVESFKLAWNAVSRFFIDAMTALGKMIYNAIFAPIVNAVRDAWNSVKSAISGAWEGAKNFVGAGGSGAGTGRAMGAVPTVAPARLSLAAMGAGRPSVQSNTNVTVTVPPGTTAEQAKFLQGAAQQSFGKGANGKLARDLAVYAP